MEPLFLVLLCLAAYAAGSVLFAMPVCRLWRLPDPRAQGSGNAGATNVFRIGGWPPAVLTLALDAGKGWLPVWLAQQFQYSIYIQAVVALCAVTGHMVPAFYRFQGGKGVATFLGVLLAAAWPVGILTCLTWLGAALMFRISSLSALVCAIAAPLLCLAFGREDAALLALFLAALIYWRHRTNIDRIAKGEEPLIGAKKT